MWSRRLAPSSSLAADLDDAPQDLVATTEEYERQDKFGGLWRGRQEPMGERRLADVINTEWGTRARKLVRENDRTYIYCRCQHGCKMVVQYRVDANAGRLIREAKNEHELKPDIRADIRATAAQAENAAAALVQFSMDNPDKDLPRRDQVQNRKNYMKPLQMEDKVPQVLEFAEALKKEEGRTSWGYRVLDIDKAAGIMCLSTDFYMGRLLANWEALKQHGLRLACDGTHNISNSRIKLIALGWLAQHVPHKSIQNTFVLLAFALSPTESGPAVLKLLRSTHAMISQHVREGLNAATLAHIDGGLGLVRGFEDFFGPDFLLAVFRQIGALDEEGFHPRKVAHLYEKYTALYEEAADLVETHQDFWQSGMTEHYVFVAKESFGAAVPENFSSLDSGKPALVDLHFPDPFNPPAGEQPELLGTANDGVPAEVHQRMQRLAQAGVIPITTPDQRARIRGSGGTEYGVPAAFANARRFSYVHPNLPPPTGYHWRCRGSEWTLCVKGG
eukprot:s563_g23.t1